MFMVVKCYHLGVIDPGLKSCTKTKTCVVYIFTLKYKHIYFMMKNFSPQTLPPGGVDPSQVRNQAFPWQRTQGQNEYKEQCE